MIKENDLVEVHSSPYLPLNKSKGVVLQVFPYLKMAVVSFPLEVKHYEAGEEGTSFKEKYEEGYAEGWEDAKDLYETS